MMEFDPNKTLEGIRARGTALALMITDETALAFAALVCALDEWLSKGGHPPAAWDPFSKQPEKGK